MDPKTGAVAATDKPAQVTEQKKEVDVKSIPQFKAREEIARRVEAARQQDAKDMKFDILHEDGTITPAEEVAAVQKTVETELGEKPVEAKTDPVVESEEMRELIVDGKKIQVPLSKILDAGVRTFQKETAADMRLAAASELERQARAKLENFAPAQAAQPQQAVQPSDEDAILAKAIQFGTEEEAKAAIAKLRGSARATTPQELRQFVQGSLATDIPQHLEFYEANRWVKNEYKEIFSDPDLTQIFMNKEVAARRAGDQRSFSDLYKTLADEMTEKFHLKVPEAKTEQADRIVRKAQSPQVASAAAGRSAAPAEKKVPTVTDYVQRQRELRGLAPMPRNNQGI
jgi:hypothetical protein